MINSSRERDFEAKQEESAKDNKLAKPTIRSTTTTTSRQWAGFKNPRIVRVSRTFGGKDRHSKVCTVRGLRDRRIRLSVPTAIQLYDLQDRLGLSQPSKVVDWLLDATKDEIDKLPPLQLPPGSFGQYFHHPNLTHDPPHLSPFFNSDGGTQIDHQQQHSQRDDHGKSKYSDMDVDHSGIYSNSSRGKGKESEIREGIVDVNKWMTSSSSSNHHHMAQLSAQNFFPVANQSSFPSLPFNSYNHWEPSNLSLSQFGTQGFHHSQQTDQQTNINAAAHHFVSPLALPSASQLFLTQSVFPVDQTSSDPRQFNHFQHVFQNSYMPNLQLINQLNVYPKVQSQNDENKSEGGS